jgi:hypothetical protein
VKCSLFGHWAHDTCAGVEEQDCDEYSCDFFKNIKEKWLALVYHCFLYNKFLIAITNHSNNQANSATTYTPPICPTCRVKQGFCIVLQNS